MVGLHKVGRDGASAFCDVVGIVVVGVANALGGCVRLRRVVEVGCVSLWRDGCMLGQVGGRVVDVVVVLARVCCGGVCACCVGVPSCCDVVCCLVCASGCCADVLSRRYVCA